MERGTQNTRARANTRKGEKAGYDCDKDDDIPDGRVIIMSGYDTAADVSNEKDINHVLERVDTSLPEDLWQASYDILAKVELPVPVSETYTVLFGRIAILNFRQN